MLKHCKPSFNRLGLLILQKSHTSTILTTIWSLSLMIFDKRIYTKPVGIMVRRKNLMATTPIHYLCDGLVSPQNGMCWCNMTPPHPRQWSVQWLKQSNQSCWSDQAKINRKNWDKPWLLMDAWDHPACWHCFVAWLLENHSSMNGLHIIEGLCCIKSKLWESEEDVRTIGSWICCWCQYVWTAMMHQRSVR